MKCRYDQWSPTLFEFKYSTTYFMIFSIDIAIEYFDQLLSTFMLIMSASNTQQWTAIVIPSLYL